MIKRRCGTDAPPTRHAKHIKKYLSTMKHYIIDMAKVLMDKKFTGYIKINFTRGTVESGKRRTTEKRISNHGVLC
jgi:hypothetical protein